MVAKAFHKDTYKEGLIVNHKDLDKSNCYYKNLEWVTPKENSDHYVENMPAHASNHRREIPVDKIHEICRLIESGKTTEEIYNITKISRNKISKLRSGALYSWITKEYTLKPEPANLDKTTVIEICELLEKGFGCKSICDLYKDNDAVHKKSVNNIKYRNSYEEISNNYTWWVGKYISKSERRNSKGKTFND